MIHASLFSGIGGFDLAASIVGWQNKFHCEIDPFCQKVLQYHFPEAITLKDITKTDFRIYENTIDIISGGFPCQPFSQAGKRKGSNDSRYLWREMFRAICEIKPKYIIAENVYGLLNIEKGLVFQSVLTDLESQGYEVQSYIIPAAGKNAPHQRSRLFIIGIHPKRNIVTNTSSNGSHHESQTINKRKNTKCEKWNSTIKGLGIQRNVTNTNCCGINQRKQEVQSKKSNGEWIKCESCKRDVTNTNCNGFNQCHNQYEKSPSQTGINAFNNINKSNGNGDATNTNCIKPGKQRTKNCREQNRFTGNNGQKKSITNTNCNRLFGSISTDINKQKSSKKTYDAKCLSTYEHDIPFAKFPTQSPICSRNDGFPTKLDSITFPKWRIESIKAYGNSVCVPVIVELFKMLEEYESY